jgi:hypothetical protein
VEVRRDMISLARSLARSGDKKQEREERVRPASYYKTNKGANQRQGYKGKDQ